MNNSKMQPIWLKMGKASVLRFSEKPVKVVVGNQNYYSIEFIESDLTIQPLGEVDTNLFVYTPYRTYGFALQVCHGCRSDDLVYVKWKSKVQSSAIRKSNLKAIPGFRSIGVNFDIHNLLSVTVIKTMVDSARSLRFIDLHIKNISKSKTNIVPLRIVATRAGIPLKDQGYVVERDILKDNEISKARLFIFSKETAGFTINTLIDGKEGKAIIGRKYLR